ncbi:MAG: nitroreductase family protein [Candidatus Bathyarchaeia archaeon]
MDALRCILSKRETRIFLDKPVPREIVTQVLEAGRVAGSAKNRQPWSFILVQDKQQLKELSRYGQFAQHLPQAGFAIVIVTNAEYMQDPFDAGRAAQNMMLAAHALGLGSCPLTFHDEEGAKKFLGVPEEKRVQVGIAFGYPAEQKRRGKIKRRAFEQIVRYEKWLTV